MKIKAKEIKALDSVLEYMKIYMNWGAMPAEERQKCFREMDMLSIIITKHKRKELEE